MTENLKLFGTVLRTQDQDVNETASDVPLILNEETSGKTSVPGSFDGRTIWGKYLSPIMDQGQCGGCYSFAITSTLQDKFALYTNNEVKPFLNPLEAIMCHIAGLTKHDQLLWAADPSFRESQEARTKYTACKGGTLYEIARYYYRLGAVEDSCVSNKTIQQHLENTGELPLCSSITGPLHNKCETKSEGDIPDAQRRWPVLNFYVVSKSNDLRTVAKYMKYDICTKGPIAAGFNMYNDFLEEYTGEDVYVPREGQEVIGGHAVKIVGWGSTVQDGKLLDYWICANSWGPDWGDDGYYKMVMADPLLATELNHLSIIPQIPGIMKHFEFATKASEVREMDTILRNNINVNPFTLYDKNTTKLIQEGKLNGSFFPPVFEKFDYKLDPSLFSCRTERSWSSKWADATGGYVLMAITIGGFILFGLFLGVLWHLIFRRYPGVILVRRR